MNDDRPLLQQYVEDGSRPALEELIQRYLGLVYSAALRQLRDPHRAEDAVQAVFLILTQKARTVRSNEALGGWLLAVTRSVAVSAMRKQAINQRYERGAAKPEALEEAASAWEEVAPVIDAELNRLPRIDRDAIVLRFFEDRSFAEIGAQLGLTEEAARKRVARSLERLRSRMNGRGSAASTLSTALGAFGVVEVPKGLLATKIAANVMYPSTQCLSLAKGALQVIAYTKAKLAGGIAACLVVGGTTAVLFSGALAQTPRKTPEIVKKEVATQAAPVLAAAIAATEKAQPGPAMQGVALLPEMGGPELAAGGNGPANDGLDQGIDWRELPVIPTPVVTETPTQVEVKQAAPDLGVQVPVPATAPVLPPTPTPTVTPTPPPVFPAQTPILPVTPRPVTPPAPPAPIRTGPGQADLVWSNLDMDSTPKGNVRFHGPFGNETVNVTAANLAAHAYVEVSLDLLVLRSWDGSVKMRNGRPDVLGPDFFRLGMLEGPTLLYTSFSNMPPDPGFHPESKFQNYPSQVPGTTYAPQSGAVMRNSLGYLYPWEGAPKPYPMDAVYHLDFVIPHHESRAVVQLSGALSQNLIDESWGVANLQIRPLTADAVKNSNEPVIVSAFEAALNPNATHQPEAFQALVLGMDDTATWILQNVTPRWMDPARATALIKLLDGDDTQIATRDAAVNALCAMGPEVEPYLRAARNSAVGDQRLRIDWVLQNISTTVITDQELRRILLATRVLEVIGTPLALEVSHHLTETVAPKPNPPGVARGRGVIQQQVLRPTPAGAGR